MVCVSAFYPAAGQGRFDFSYYMDKHIPMVDATLRPYGLQKIEVDEGVSGFSAAFPPNYLVVCRMYFDTLENFQAGLASVGSQILADVPNYTDIPVELQVSKLLR